MKNIILIFVFACLFSASSAFADDEQLVPPINPDAQGRGLVDTDISTLNNKVSELDRRIRDLERDKRFYDDRIRQLDREVNDIKRRF